MTKETIAQAEWLIAANIGFALIVLLFTLSRVVRLKFSRSRTSNYLTLKPFYTASFLLLLIILDAWF